MAIVIRPQLLLHAQLEWYLHHMLPYRLPANAYVSWRRLLRIPPHLPLLGRGVPQVRQEIVRESSRKVTHNFLTGGLKI